MALKGRIMGAEREAIARPGSHKQPGEAKRDGIQTRPVPPVLITIFFSPPFLPLVSQCFYSCTTSSSIPFFFSLRLPSSSLHFFFFSLLRVFLELLSLRHSFPSFACLSQVYLGNMKSRADNSVSVARPQETWEEGKKKQNTLFDGMQLCPK